MKKILVVLKDAKSESFADPVVVDTPAAAIRMFGDLVNSGRSLPSKFPVDFDLFKIATWEQLPDEPRPVLLACQPFEHLANGLDVCVKMQNTTPEKGESDGHA